MAAETTPGYDPRLLLRQQIEAQFPDLLETIKRLHHAGCEHRIILGAVAHFGAKPDTLVYNAIGLMLEEWTDEEEKARCKLQR